MRIVLALLASLAFASCTAGPGQTAVTPAPVAEGPVALDESVRVGKLIVTPIQLVEDSRCPMNARCIWAGRVVLSTRIQGPGWQETADLTLGEAYSTHGTSITLVSVAPEQMTEAETAPADYRFGFEGGN